MKVALVAESFLPHTNGVTHSLLRVIDHLAVRGDDVLVIAPEGRRGEGPTHYGPARIARVPAVGWPGYRDVRVSVANKGLVAAHLDAFRPDVVHLASPFVLGWAGVRAAGDLGLPVVAVYQTEVPSYAEQYGLGWGESFLWNRVRNIHTRATITLAPSSAAIAQLEALGVGDVRRWARGVDSSRFHPSKRSPELRADWAPHGETVVGYVGRLAPEKRVGDLAALARIPGISLVVVGDGPSAARAREELPTAHFTGFLGGEDLARAVASFDVFAHCGEFETFGQTLQEAFASGVPVVAPRRGGPVDLVQDGVNGFLYAPGDLAEMGRHVRTIIRNPDTLAAFSRRARASVAHRTWTSVCDDLLEHYDDAILAATPAASAVVA